MATVAEEKIFSRILKDFFILTHSFPNAPFLYPLKTDVFRGYRGCIGNEWVKAGREKLSK